MQEDEGWIGSNYMIEHKRQNDKTLDAWWFQMSGPKERQLELPKDCANIGRRPFPQEQRRRSSVPRPLALSRHTQHLALKLTPLFLPQDEGRLRISAGEHLQLLLMSFVTNQLNVRRLMAKWLMSRQGFWSKEAALHELLQRADATRLGPTETKTAVKVFAHK